MTQNDANPNLIIFEQFPCFAPLEILITWSPFIAVGYYRTAVGYYRVIAKNTKTEKFTPIPAQNTKTYQNRPNNGGER